VSRIYNYSPLTGHCPRPGPPWPSRRANILGAAASLPNAELRNDCEHFDISIGLDRVLARMDGFHSQTNYHRQVSLGPRLATTYWTALDL
jgi:hypothetical protein